MGDLAWIVMVQQHSLLPHDCFLASIRLILNRRHPVLRITCNATADLDLQITHDRRHWHCRRLRCALQRRRQSRLQFGVVHRPFGQMS